ncbi:MAG: YaaR family protein [Treponema sp.]|jgi:uncharacterized protein YaaR (DUF327 family)|nr:YaaR family protein [Treponema sp.]
MAKVDTPGGSIPFNPLSSSLPAALGLHQGAAKKSRDKSSPVRGGTKTPFTRLLEEAEGPAKAGETAPPRELPPSEEAVQELLDEVHIAGDNLKNRPFPEEIMAYKKAVRNFLHHVVEYGYCVEHQEGTPNYLKAGYKGHFGDPDFIKRKDHIRIRVVDHKLEELAAGILSGQITQLKLLARIEEIAGILIDLLQ